MNSLNHSLNIIQKMLTRPSTHFLDGTGLLLTDDNHSILTCTSASSLLVPRSQCCGMNTHSEGQRLGDCFRRIKVDCKGKLTMSFLAPCCMFKSARPYYCSSLTTLSFPGLCWSVTRIPYRDATVV